MTTPLHVSDLHGLSRLGIDGVHGVTDLVADVHHAVLRVPGIRAAAPEERTRGVTGLVYRSIHVITRLVGGGLDLAFAHLASRFSPPASWPTREQFLAVLNGVLGDHLAATDNPLAIQSALCRGGGRSRWTGHRSPRPGRKRRAGCWSQRTGCACTTFSCGLTVLICLNTLYPEIYLGIDVEASGPFVPIVAWELRPLLTGGLLDSFAVELPAQGVPPTAGPFTVGVGLGGIELPSGLSAETEDPIGSRCPLKDPSVCTVIEEPSLTLTRATLLVTGIPVPEPAAGALLAAGLAAAMGWGRSPRRPAS